MATTISQTDAAILGMLTVQPMSGYDMKKFTEQSLAHFWHESYGNLYPRLKQLEAAGLVRARRQRRERGPDAIVYTLAAAGRRRLRAWLTDDPEPERIRNEMLLKVFFGAQGSLELCRGRLAADKREQEAKLLRYAEIGELAAGAGERPDSLFWRMSLRRGVLLTEARLRWCDECIRMIDAIQTESAA